MLGVTLRWTSIPWGGGGGEAGEGGGNTPSRFILRKPKDGPLGSYAHFTFLRKYSVDISEVIFASVLFLAFAAFQERAKQLGAC